MKKAFILALPLLFLLCGCWDYTELNMQNYVLGMSIDYENDKFLICVETIKITGEPTSLSASEGIIIKSEGLTVFDAVRDAIMTAGKKLYWGHAKLIIISEDVAAQHLPAVCDVLSRAQDIYSNISICVAKNSSAADILNSKTPSGTLISEHISNILENEEPSRRFISTQLWQLLRDFEYTMLPTVFLNEFPLVDGSAVISNEKVIGFLNGEETQIYSLLQDAGNGGYIPYVSIDDTVVSLEILRSKRILTRLDVTVSVASCNGNINKINDFKEKVCRECEKIISGQIESLMSKPFGNILPADSFDVHVKLNATGLLRS